jgi:hypothetical protein
MSNSEEYEAHYSPDGEYMQYQMENPKMHEAPPETEFEQALYREATELTDREHIKLMQAHRSDVAREVIAALMEARKNVARIDITPVEAIDQAIQTYKEKL